MRLAVTGASGFVGRHVLAELSRRDVDVIATARSASGDASADGKVRWVPLDLASPPQDVFRALHGPDVLLHLAWGGLPNYRSPRHVEAELPAQDAFLSNAVRNGLPALVVAGTCLEYGLQSGPLAAETETRPITQYGLAKDALRRKLQALQMEQPYRLTWARLFYMYGDDQPATSLFPSLKAASAAGRKEFPMSGGEQLRDYLPVAEVARRLVELAMNPVDRGPVNVCSGRPISVRSLVEAWIAEHHWQIEPRFGELPYPDYEPMAFWGEGGQA
ncbi:NAD(P)-dependent oxidoreductase [Bradyrhizobium lablabi]|uniref:NAD-dependent epimerase/dehydratase family protein n=1 Tax=Bradyrhizobium lablabi TaxID=722472 RepID=UPI001BA596E8|nr:NAD(P)-dependent oxidoreductase [Bradyrhizobium lablabi]MBR1120195.1 NAD(P)-dependent oxidoreductase [Bradyrhizobium lablabi]